MAIGDLYTVDSGTATNGDLFIYSTTASTGSTWVAHEPIAPPPRARVTPPIVRDPFAKKEFWDGVEWKKHTSYVPRRSITGRWIIGPMYKRWRSADEPLRGPNGIGNFTQFAGKKELFEEKLRGNA